MPSKRAIAVWIILIALCAGAPVADDQIPSSRVAKVKEATSGKKGKIKNPVDPYAIPVDASNKQLRAFIEKLMLQPPVGKSPEENLEILI